MTARATRADVARRAGVSAGVVSYVLNGGPRPVADETRKRVEEAIAALHYRPNASARALVLARSDTLGLLVPDMRNPFFSEFAKHVQDVAAASGRIVIIANTDLDPEREAAQLDTVLSRDMDGIVAFALRDATTRERLVGSGVPIVSMDWQFQEQSIPTVVADDYAAARSAVDHLVWHGYTPIAFIGGSSEIDPGGARRRAWRDATAPAAERDELLRLDEYSLHGGYRAARALLEGPMRPRAIFVSSDVQAIGALRAIHELGLRIPDDVALVSFDGTDESRFTLPSLTAVRLPLRLMAEHAVSRLLTPENEAGLHLTVEHELVVRESCGCAAPATRA